MEYLAIPREIGIDEIRQKKFSWSPHMYRKIKMPTNNFKSLRELLDYQNPFDKGIEPGSMWYMDRSTHYFIRTRALQKHSCLLYDQGEAIIPINPNVFKYYDLCDGDILLSKDSNVGECIIIDGDDYKNYMFSGGIVRIHPIIDKYYLFSFLKNPLFKKQLIIETPRGATIKHAKSLWLDCLIPFPVGNDNLTIKYISVLTQAIIEKERAIKNRCNEIHQFFNLEINSQQKEKGYLTYSYSYPNFNEVNNIGRMDAAIYGSDYKNKIIKLLNYKYGTKSPKQMGLEVTPGPSLEIKIIGTRVDSRNYKPGFYSLILPTNISQYGTMLEIPYLGTPKKLPLLNPGDIIFGESGSHRSTVLIKHEGAFTTNAHGLYARHKDDDTTISIFFRCYFDWLYKNGIIDLLSVGGSGGHFSPVYFNDFIQVPDFPRNKQEAIARLYHNDVNPPKDEYTLDSFVSWHRKWNQDLGIFELDLEMKNLRQMLAKVQDMVIKGEEFEVLFEGK